MLNSPMLCTPSVLPQPQTITSSPARNTPAPHCTSPNSPSRIWRAIASSSAGMSWRLLFGSSTTFTTSNAEKTIYLYSNNIVSNVKTGNTLYSEKTGIITESANIFQFAMYNYERRLVRYHVN
jgi:hypothetical protein